MRVLLAGGGTAGHVEPALATADALRRIAPGTECVLLGTARGLETRLVPGRGYRLELVEPVPLPRHPSIDLARMPTRLRRAVRETVAILARDRIDVVAGFGGYVAVPAYLAARRARLPIVVHEANARVGVANRLGSRFARVVAVATPVAAFPHAVHVGMPLRTAISGLDRDGARDGARQHWRLDSARPVLLVFGGSQGARRLNDAVVAAARALLDAGVQVLHATGTNNLADVESGLAAAGVDADKGYRAVPYVEDMALAYAAADLAVCRAGAMTVAEVTAVGLPAVYVPLPIGNGEQRLNAQPVVGAGGGVLIDDAAVDGPTLADCVLPLVADPARLEQMAQAARALGRRDADVALARLILDAAGVA